MAEQEIIVQQDGAVSHVILNRPDRMNSLVKPMWPLLAVAFNELSADDEVRCVVLRGAGQAFTVGADVSEYKSERFDAAHAESYGRLMGDAFSQIKACPHPVIAAIRGPCTGIGLVLAMLCDIRISTESSRFGASTSRLGIALSYPEFSVLFNSLGRDRTLELVLEGRLVEAPEAQTMGIVNRVVLNDEFELTVSQMAERIAAGAPLVNKWHKSFADRLCTGVPLEAAEVSASYASFDTGDYQEGYKAFLRKRAPNFFGN